MTAKANYARSAATAVRLLGKFGMEATLRRRSGEKYNPDTASMESAFTDLPCTVALVDYSARDLDGTLIQASDRRLLVAPDIEQAPQSGDVFVLGDGARLTAIRVVPTAPAGVVVLYDVQARGQ